MKFRSRRAWAAVVAVLILAPNAASCDGSQDGPEVASVQPSQATSNARGDVSAANDAAADDAAVIEQYISAMKRYVGCLRSRGMPKAPDPGQFGTLLFNAEMTTGDGPARAQKLCKNLMVPMPAAVSAALTEYNAGQVTPEQKRVFAKYSRCMQASGAPDFPDPGADGLGDEKLWDQTSAGARRATAACASIIGDPVSPGPGVG